MSIGSKFRDIKNTITNNPSFTMREQLGYAGGIFGNCMGQDSVGTFSDKFFRKYMKIEANSLTLMGNISIFLNLVTSAIAGNILDKPTPDNKKTPTKILTGTMPIPFAISSMMLFIVPSANIRMNFIWALIFKMIFETSDIFYDTSLNTLSLRMTRNAKDRKNFYTVSQLASALGSMLPGWLIPLLVGSTEVAAKQQRFYFFAALIFCVLGITLMYAPFFTLTEKIRVTEKPKKTRINWDRENVIALLHNRTFIITEIGTLFEMIRQLSYTLLPYIYEDVFDDYKLKAGIDVVSGILSYVGLLTVPFLGNHFAARTIISCGFGYTGIFYSIMGLLGLGFKAQKIRRRKYLIGLLIGLAGMPNNAISASKKVMVGDSTDYMEWYSEKRFGRPLHSEGLICAAQSIINHVFNVIRTNLYNILFGKLGYLPNYTDSNGIEVEAVQTEKTLKGIYAMFVLCGVIGNFVTSIAYLFDNYTGKRKERIYAELTEMREARKKLVEENEGA
ncbi:MAG: MFS transporter [Clostridia bacterium]|nr:MFS transporter [Clostridia bacterium]